MDAIAMDNTELFSIAAEAIDQADGLLITAGAGMGVDSGLPDFRGGKGFWQAYPALKQAGIDFSTIASPTTFRDDPALAWGFYGDRLKLYRDTVPHEGFAILREFARFMEHGAFVFTSNVDGQFQKAGFPPGEVVECHGSIHHLQCLNGCMGDIWATIDFKPEVDETRCRLLNDPPHCPLCDGLARPNILMFGDWDWQGHRYQEQNKRLEQWLGAVKRLVIIEIGAGTAIPSVRNFSEFQEGFLIRINLREPFLPTGHRGIELELSGLEALAGIRDALHENAANHYPITREGIHTQGKPKYGSWLPTSRYVNHQIASIAIISSLCKGIAMPQLPSGRQVAISPAPLVALLDAANQPGNIHKILAIQSAQDLEQYIDVLFFITEDETCEPVLQVAYRDEALPRPPGMVLVSSGHTLAAWVELTANWSDEDKVAMHDFLDTRAAPALNEYLEAVTKVQTNLRGADDFLTKTLTLWWDAGIHPAQEEGWDESDVGGPQWDTYDLIAALGQLAVQFHSQPELIEQFGSANDLLFSYWNLVQQILSLPPHWPNSSQPIRECANQARECGFLDAVTDQDRQWLRDQGISIAISVWNILGDAFQARFPQPYGIIELVVVSPDANKYFSARHEPC